MADLLANVQKYESRFWGKVDMSGDCWRWRGSNNGRNYGQMHVGAKRMALSHRVAWTLVHGPIPNGLEVMHRCDNPACVKPSHLALGTHADNMADAASKGIMPWGKRHKWNRLSERKARQIKESLARGLPPRRAAEVCGVPYHYAYDIASGKSWRHLK